MIQFLSQSRNMHVERAFRRFPIGIEDMTEQPVTRDGLSGSSGQLREKIELGASQVEVTTFVACDSLVALDEKHTDSQIRRSLEPGTAQAGVHTFHQLVRPEGLG